MTSSRGTVLCIFVAVLIASRALFACGGSTGGIGDSGDAAAADVVDAGAVVLPDAASLPEASLDGPSPDGAIAPEASDLPEASPEASGVSDACTLSTHSDGVGQTFEDCIALGSYSEALAIDACNAFRGMGGVGCVSATCSSSAGEALIVCTEGLMTSCACWVYSGADVGHMRLGDSPTDCPCDDMTTAGAPTAYQ